MTQAMALSGNWAQAVHQDDREKVAQAWYISAQARQHFIMEYRIQRPTGVIRWVQGEAAAERDAQGKIVGYVGTITDITQSKQAEENLRESEVRYRSLFENMLNGFAYCRMQYDDHGCPVDFVYLGVNEAFGRLTGLKNVVGKSVSEVIPGIMEQSPELFDIYGRVASTGIPEIFDFYLKLLGKWFAISVYSPKKGYFVAVFDDITERKRLEAAQLEALDRFQKITQLVPGIVYQFRLRPDGSTCVPYASEATREIYLLDPEEIREDASKAFTHVHPDDLENHLASIQASARDLTPWQQEYRLKFDDGTVRWLFGNGLPKHEADGSTLWHGFITDITERKQAGQALAESESRFREIFNTVSDAIFIHDADTGRIIDVNQRMCEMYGLTREQALACGPDDLSASTPPYSSAEAIEKIHLARTEGPQTFDWLARASDGRLFWVEVSLRFAFIGSQQRILAVVRDITERKQADEAMRQSEAKYRRLFDDAAIGVFHSTMEGRFIEVNPALARMLGYDSPHEAVSSIHNISEQIYVDPPQRANVITDVLAKGETVVSENYYRRKDGTTWVGNLILRYVMDAHGQPQYLEGFVEDITERKRAEAQIYDLAFHDSLTRLPNRRLLNDRLEQTMAAAKRSGLYGALMFLDLDNFKPLNDTYGHDVGDLLLVEVAHRISSCVREVDTVARFGGDEFMVMLGELDGDKAASATQAGIVAEKIRAVLAETYVLKIQHEGKTETTIEHHCTSSIGVVLFINHENSAEDIIKFADLAMYQAKNSGRNLIHFYE